MTCYRKTRPIRYLAAAVVCFVLALTVMLLAGCGKTWTSSVTMQPLKVVNGQTVDEWIEDLEENPPRRDPLQFGYTAPWQWRG